MNIGENIKKYRMKKGLTQKQLTELTLIPVISIGRYERGDSKIDIDTLIKIAEALGVTLNDLINCDIQNQIDENKHKWNSEIKDFNTSNIENLIKELKSLNLTKADKSIVLQTEKIYICVVSQYEYILKPLQEKVLNNEISNIYDYWDAKLKTGIGDIEESLVSMASILKTIKDKYI